MLSNAFIDKSERPTARELGRELGSAKALWERLLADLANDCGAGVQEWNSYSRKAGWSLRVKRDKRTILYLSPSRGCFMASFALGDKAVKKARASKLPERAIKIIDTAKRYAEGTAVRIDVNDANDLAIVKELARIKVEN